MEKDMGLINGTKVLTLPAEDTYTITNQYCVHAYPQDLKGFNYKYTDYIAFRKKGGKIERIYKTIETIVLDPAKMDYSSVPEEYVAQIKEYHSSRANSAFDFESSKKHGSLYNFLILKKVLELPTQFCVLRNTPGPSYYYFDAERVTLTKSH